MKPVLRLLFLFYPRSFREEFGEEWLAVVRDRRRRFFADGRPLPGLRFILFLLRDTLRSAPRLRFGREEATPPAHPQRRSSPHRHSGSHSTLRDASTMGTLLQDLRFAARTLKKRPAFTLTAVGTLGLGIGVSLAMFGVVNSAMMSPLPFSESHRLVMGRATFDGEINPWVAGADYYDYRDRAGVFENLGALLEFEVPYTITGQAEPETVSGNTVSVDLFSTLRVRPRVGRSFSEEEGLAGAAEVVILSHGFWERRFGGDGDVVGTSLMVNGSSFTIVGVMPAGFRFLNDVDLWLPMRPDRDSVSDRRFHNWLLVGRLGGDGTLEEAQNRVDVVSAHLQEAYPETNAGWGLLLTDLQDVLLEDYRLRLLLLTGAVALVLLIACGNVTGMILARAPARRQELSVRAALGAGRSRLARQLLSEGLALSAGGGILGVGLAFWFQRVVLDLLQMDRLGIAEGGVSPSVLLFAVVVSMSAGLLTGLYPAARSARGDLARDLKDGARNSGGGGTGFRSSLVVAQVALSIVLLVGAGLLIRSLTGVSAVHPGFDARNLVTFDIELPDSRYPDGGARAGFYTDLLIGLEAIPGVGSVAMTSNLPIRHRGNTFRARMPGDEGEGLRVFLRGVRPGYFAAMGIPVLMGRQLREEDGTGTISLMDAGDPIGGDPSRVAVISESMARAAFPDQSPLGKQLDLDFFGTPRRVEVVGVVGDVRLTALEFDPESAMYLPFRQFATRRVGVALRTEAPLGSIAGAIREAVWRLDRDIPVSGLSTLERDIAASVADRRIIALALSLYALLPLLLAGVGLYAVVAYYVAQRAHEIGVRMALGADPRQVGMLILRRGAALTAAGIATGLMGALGLTRFLRGLLFGVEPTDPGTFLAVTVFVLLVALAACVVPTWRAVRSDPRVALRAN